MQYISKKDIGKLVYCIPTGNSVKRNTPLNEQIVAFELLHMTPLKFKLRKGSAALIYPFEGYDNQNSGYRPFTSLEHAQKYLMHKEFVRDLKYSNKLANATSSQLDRIIEILEENNG